jgi:hypothetical protein
MGHINFDNLVKISTKQAVRDMPNILNLQTLFASNVSMENIQEQALNQRNTQQRSHWNSFIQIFVGLQEHKVYKVKITSCCSLMIILE